MPTMRRSVFSLLRILCFTVAIFVGRGFAALQTQAPQTPDQTQARDLLNQGVQSFKNGQSDEAARLFEQAKNLDPNLLNARLYLATAYASQFIPGAPSEENRQLGQKAVDEFKGVLQVDPEDLNAIDGIGALLFQMAGTPPANMDLFKESKSFHEKHIQIDPADPHPYYWIGVIDWTLAFRANSELRAKYNESLVEDKLPDSDPLPPFLQVRYAAEWNPTIEEGIERLRRALALRPDYDDAMAYLNLLYRRKADTVETQAERDDLIKMADELIDQVKEIKQKRIEPRAPQP
jgi:tetratricopeptide (TPR) repeat protein